MSRDKFMSQKEKDDLDRYLTTPPEEDDNCERCPDEIYNKCGGDFCLLKEEEYE